MRKLIIFLLLFIFPLSCLAVTNLKNTSNLKILNQNQNITATQNKNIQIIQTKIEKGKEIGEKMIDKRASDLSTAKTLLQSATRISATIKNELISEIDANSANLKSLKSQIQVENEVNQLRVEVRSIVTDYRIYIVFLPKIRGLAVVDRLKYFSEKLTELKGKISEKVEQLKNAGQNTSDIETLINQAEIKINQANNDLSTAESKFNSMEVSNPSSATTLKNEGKQILISVRENLRSAKASLREAIGKIKELAEKTKTVSGTGYLYVEGNGNLKVKGKGIVSGTTDTGATAVITDYTNDVQVDTQGQGKKEDLGNNQARYTGFGYLRVSGKDFQAVITGNNLSITASGTGIVTMIGTGSYRISKDGLTQDIPVGGLNTNL